MLIVIIGYKFKVNDYDSLYAYRKLTSGTVISTSYAGKQKYIQVKYSTESGMVTTDYAYGDRHLNSAELIVGKSLPLFYDSTQVDKIRLLFSKEEFEEFGLVQPDSLK